MNGDYGRVMPAICVRKRAYKGQLTKAQAKSELETRGKKTRRKARQKNLDEEAHQKKKKPAEAG